MKQEQPPGDMGLNEIQENGSTFGNLNSAIILKDRGQVFSLSVLPECSVHTSEGGHIPLCPHMILPLCLQVNDVSVCVQIS
ncbi:psychosine receptor isoform X6 [Panthera tigris]|uniref:psychosine receptor isoform X6 n=1 Tax=Panthera tigris TaxID=9694 RepID=UPI001C6FA1B6|nr:psychosine receptor isoform X6 [Panthera tigris]